MRLVRLSAKCMAPLQERLKAVRGQMRVANNQHQRVVGDGDLLKEREDEKRNEKSQANHNQPTFNSNRSVTAPHCVQRIFNLHQLAGRATRASESNIATTNAIGRGVTEWETTIQAIYTDITELLSLQETHIGSSSTLDTDTYMDNSSSSNTPKPTQRQRPRERYT